MMRIGVLLGFVTAAGFKKTNGVQFKFANQKLLCAKGFHIPSIVVNIFWGKNFFPKKILTTIKKIK